MDAVNPRQLSLLLSTWIDVGKETAPALVKTLDGIMAELEQIREILDVRLPRPPGLKN